MANVTLSLSDDLVRAGREYAERHGTSLNALIRELLEKTVSPAEGVWPDEFLARIKQARGNSRGWKWNREEIQRYG
jgi:plasmid stability protein